MAKKVLIALGIVVLVLLAIQLVPFGRDHTNPPVQAEPAWDSPQTRALFMTACGDCHSNESAWPWYTNVAPSSWFVQNHVDEGREKFNVSEWGLADYDADEAAELVENGEMPLRTYLWMHPEAKLSDADREALVTGLVATFGRASEGGEREAGEGE